MSPDAALPTFRLDRGTTLAQAQPTDNSPFFWSRLMPQTIPLKTVLYAHGSA